MCNKCEGTKKNTTCDDTSTKIVQSEDFSIYEDGMLPENAEVIMLVNGADNQCGGTMTRAYRLPLSRLAPGSSIQSTTYSVYSPNNTINVTGEQVVPAYTDVNVPYEIKKARADSQTSLAKYIVLGVDPNSDERLIIQSAGFYTFSGMHNYVVGKQYYLSATDAGQVVTAEPATPNVSQPLFYVIDNKTILINL